MSTPPTTTPPPLAVSTSSHTTSANRVPVRGWRRAALWVAIWFGAGLAPKAPGTFGTVAALPLAWLLATVRPAWPFWPLVVLLPVSMVAAQVAGRHYGVADAKQIVVDEVCGLLLALWGLPWRWPVVLVGFALFRLLDITKPWPASYFDRKVKNGAGVVLDDLAAGLMARLVLAGLGWQWPSVFGP